MKFPGKNFYLSFGLLLLVSAVFTGNYGLDVFNSEDLNKFTNPHHNYTERHLTAQTRLLRERSECSAAEKRVRRIEATPPGQNQDKFESLSDAALTLELSVVEFHRYSGKNLIPDRLFFEKLEDAYSRFLGLRSNHFGRTELMNEYELRFRTLLIDSYLLEEKLAHLIGSR